MNEIKESEKISSYFREFSNQLVYLELKKNFESIQSVDLTEIPLPICMFDFSDNILENKFNEEIEWKYFLRGMIWNIAIDREFIYQEKYNKILNESLRKPCDFAIQMGQDFLMNKLFDKALIAFRAAYLLDSKNNFASVEYAELLWQYGGKDEEFIKEASHIMENVLSGNENHPFANMALGKLNVAIGRYIKASSYFQHALESIEDENVIDEIRNILESITPDVGIENAIYYLNRSDYDKAKEELIKVKSISNRYDTEYYLGLVYENTGKFEAAAEAFREAINKGANFGDCYNDLAYCMTAIGKSSEALEICNEGLDHFPAELRLRYNRAILLHEIGKFESAIEDLDFILEYADLSDEMFNQSMILKEAIRKMMN